MRWIGAGTGSPARRVVTVWALALGLAAWACAPARQGEEPAPQVAQNEDALASARAAADRLTHRLMDELGAQLERGSPAAAIPVCAEIAPAAAKELSVDDVRIRRTSLRTRNPANSPDDWEAAWLRELEATLAGGGAPYEVHEVDGAGTELRYLRPIVVGEVCLVCHGSLDQLDAEARERIGELYPEDRATGYSAGDLRGAFSVRVRLSPTRDR